MKIDIAAISGNSTIFLRTNYCRSSRCSIAKIGTYRITIYLRCTGIYTPNIVASSQILRHFVTKRIFFYFSVISFIDCVSTCIFLCCIKLHITTTAGSKRTTIGGDIRIDYDSTDTVSISIRV